MQGKARHGEDGCHKQGIHFPARHHAHNGDEAEDDQQIVEEGGDGARTIAEGVGHLAKGEGDVAEHNDGRNQNGDKSGLGYFSTDGGADAFDQGGVGYERGELAAQRFLNGLGIIGRNKFGADLPRIGQVFAAQLNHAGVVYPKFVEDGANIAFFNRLGKLQFKAGSALEIYANVKRPPCCHPRKEHRQQPKANHHPR